MQGQPEGCPLRFACSVVQRVWLGVGHQRASARLIDRSGAPPYALALFRLAQQGLHEGAMGEEGPPKTEMINPALLDGVSANFIVKGPSGVEKAYPMRAITVIIGRSDQCDIS